MLLLQKYTKIRQKKNHLKAFVNACELSQSKESIAQIETEVDGLRDPIAALRKMRNGHQGLLEARGKLEAGDRLAAESAFQKVAQEASRKILGEPDSGYIVQPVEPVSSGN